MLARLACLAALALSASVAEAQRLPAVYAEGIGATAGYTVGLEQMLVRSADGGRRLSLRVGAGYWAGKTAFPQGADESVLRVPLSVLASFTLGEPFGVPTRFEAGGGAVVSHVVTDLTGLGQPGVVERAVLDAPPFVELAVRANPARRVSVRGGLVFGGKAEEVSDTDLAPLLSIGYGF